MSERKNISDLFKENEHKLQEMPSERTWRMLEGKLEQRRKRYQVQVFRQYGVAAAILLLVGLVSVMAWMGKAPEVQPLAQHTHMQVSLEDLPLSSETLSLTQQVASVSRQYQQAAPIEEGQAAQKMVPRARELAPKDGRPVPASR